MKSIARHLAIAGLALLPFSASRGGDDVNARPGRAGRPFAGG